MPGQLPAVLGAAHGSQQAQLAGRQAAVAPNPAENVHVDDRISQEVGG